MNGKDSWAKTPGSINLLETLMSLARREMGEVRVAVEIVDCIAQKISIASLKGREGCLYARPCLKGFAKVSTICVAQPWPKSLISGRESTMDVLCQTFYCPNHCVS